jgi:hypothetical protein
MGCPNCHGEGLTGDSDEPEGYKPESAALYDGTPGSGSIVKGAA